MMPLLLNPLRLFSYTLHGGVSRAAKGADVNLTDAAMFSTRILKKNASAL
jgi:hypothetical protein